MAKKQKTWIEIHQICGDCGRPFKVKIDLEKNSLKTVLMLVKVHYPKYQMACSRCSNKRVKLWQKRY